MEFKNLAEVTQLEEVPEGASVLAATAEGEVVRVPGDGLGGGGTFIVTLSTTDGQTWTADRTFAEIKGAYMSGVFVRGMAILGDDVVSEIPFVGISDSAMFSAVTVAGKNVMSLTIMVGTDDSVSSSQAMGTLS